MPEYGHVLRVQGPKDLPIDRIQMAHKLLDRNYRKAKEQHPEWNLPENWWFRVGGPPEQVYAWLDHEPCLGRGCIECSSGLVQGPPIEGLYAHHFAWYVNTEETAMAVNPNAVQALAKHHTAIPHSDPETPNENCTCYSDATDIVEALWTAGYEVVPRPGGGEPVGEG